ncbi:diguanylate cyclase [Deinococcus deserti]|uniref:Response regulator with GAF and GGDEF domains n=1 Tax=Deinococcus deserti (strain DSM 17065 / CIP 109153 / LMG 22923 / VCD115) TaxID=546414 RepID=C1D2S4_DEIDV|nr:diguanylate cyclase [Deinococcus deserti]ACO47713.1 response regulator with GAF and GGDEF domains [Deinococcus deserti VCD115]
MIPEELRVLIVDDDESDAFLTEELLLEIETWSCRVDWVSSAHEAETHFRAQMHDVYLIDYRLGAKSGLDVLDLLRASGCSAPAILLSGVDNHGVDIAGMRLGAADYLVKSGLSAVVLERALRYALERSRLLREVHQARQEAETLFTLSVTLERSNRVEDVMREACALLGSAVGVDALLLWQVRDDHAFLLRLHGEVGTDFLEYRQRGVPRSPAFIWQAVDEHQPLYVEHAAASPLVLPLYKKAGVRSLAHLPVEVNGKVYVLSSLRLGREHWTVDERRMLEAGARSIGVALERRENLELLATAASTDVLTGLGNRRAFDQAFDVALNSASRHGVEVSVVSFDLDGLKAVNDHEGHARGDDFLRAFAQTMREGLRREDQLYRVGGDEFAAILNHTGAAGSGAVLRRVRRAVDALREAGFPQADVSAGIASYPAEAQTPGDLLRLSDERMYRQKDAHRIQQAKRS